jgi:hypothetical protein
MCYLLERQRDIGTVLLQRKTAFAHVSRIKGICKIYSYTIPFREIHWLLYVDSGILDL